MKLPIVALCLALCGALFVAAPSSAFAQEADAGPALGPEEATAPAAPDTPETTDEPASAEEAEESALSVGLELVDAVRNGNWRLAVALALGLLMALAGSLRNKVKWFKGDRGGALLVMGLALAGAVSTALMSDAKMDWKLFLGAAGVAWTAVGGYTWVKRILWPKDKESE